MITIYNKDNNIKIIGCWISTQKSNYKNKEQIMKNEEIYNKWSDFINNPRYKVYFQSNEDIQFNNLREVEKYININNKKPSKCDKDNNIKHLVAWLSNQQVNYNKKKYLMKNENIYNKCT